MDTEAQTVLDLPITPHRKHDTQIAPGLVGRNHDRFDVLSGDKGYDDRGLRKWLSSRGKRPLIRHRGFAPHDKAANARMDATLYHQRNLVETVISVIKLKSGAAVRSWVWWRQFRDLVAVCLVYNFGAGGESRGCFRLSTSSPGCLASSIEDLFLRLLERRLFTLLYDELPSSISVLFRDPPDCARCRHA